MGKYVQAFIGGVCIAGGAPVLGVAWMAFAAYNAYDEWNTERVVIARCKEILK